MSTQCGTCGATFEQSGKGRPRKYCSPECKARGCVDTRPRKTSRRVGVVQPRATGVGRGFRPARPVLDRIATNVRQEDRGYVTLCWVWQGAVNGVHEAAPEGYGTIRVGSRLDGTRRLVGAHVAAYEATYGAVPDGKELDHLCHQTICCRPDHVEPVSHSENLSDERVKLDVVARREQTMRQNQKLRWAS